MSLIKYDCGCEYVVDTNGTMMILCKGHKEELVNKNHIYYKKTNVTHRVG